MSTRRPRKPRNRGRYNEHFKYSVQWLIGFVRDDFEDPQCCAAFKTLMEAEWFRNWLIKRGSPYYGIDIVEL